MALYRDKITSSGVKVPYWSIGETNINWKTRNCVVSLQGYISQEAKQSKKDFVEVVQFRWQDEAFPFKVSENILATAYKKIKEHPDWSTAKDIK